MSKSTIIVLVIIVLVIIGGIWWWAASSNQNITSSPAAQSNNPSGAAANTPTSQTPIVSTDTSDASMDQYLSNIDGQLSGLASDSANVDASMNQSTTAQ